MKSTRGGLLSEKKGSKQWHLWHFMEVSCTDYDFVVKDVDKKWNYNIW